MSQSLKHKIEAFFCKYPNANDKEITFRLKEWLFENDAINDTNHNAKSIADLVAINLEQIKNNQPNYNFIKTGFADFDESFGGFGLGEFVVIGGRPAMGKTQLLVNLALYMSQNIPVLYFTFDLPEAMLANRFIAAVMGVPMNKIILQNLTDEEKNKLPSVQEQLSKHQLYINDNYNSSLSAFKAQCEKQINENGVKVIIVDYLQMMSNSKYRNSRELEISYVCRELKNIAKNNNVCVIAISQLSRAVELRPGAKLPQLSDLRESGAIEQDADKVLFLYRPEYYGIDSDTDGNNTAGLAELYMAKNRNGNLGSIKLLRDINFTNFRNFDEYSNDFSFSQNRLAEMTEANPNLKNLIDKLGF